MGTHPIFESDFDCLTDNEMSFNLSSLKSKVPNFTEKLESKSKSCSQHEKRNEIEPCGYCSIKFVCVLFCCAKFAEVVSAVIVPFSHIRPTTNLPNVSDALKKSFCPKWLKFNHF